MATSGAELFDQDDAALCSEIYDRIVAAHDNKVDVSALSEEERTVYVVVGAHGVIGNGGFRFLFECEVAGDPQFVMTARAFDAIGCVEAAEAFQRAFDRFPGSVPPADPSKRLRLYCRRIDTWPMPEDKQFFRAMRDIDRYLATYIRARHSAFTHLLRP